MQKVLVTGGLGFIGSNLVKLLLDKSKHLIPKLLEYKIIKYGCNHCIENKYGNYTTSKIIPEIFENNTETIHQYVSTLIEFIICIKEE